MICEFSKQQRLTYIDCANYITLIVRLWLWVEDMIKVIDNRIPRYQVKILVAIDRLWLTIGGYRTGQRVVCTFFAFYFLFCLIHLLEGGVEWLR